MRRKEYFDPSTKITTDLTCEEFGALVRDVRPNGA